ncbi:MAG: gfo/Idh/MocA family oxidoreductase, partial [Lentisphaeria bacterium]|nr:gfo/Idh/MocA family oxidoreductase [Lentisphaeria bacterium]
APAADGIRSVEMANAMLYSAMTSQRVALPMDSAAFERHLKGLIEGSTFRKRTEAGSDIKLDGSFA